MDRLPVSIDRNSPEPLQSQLRQALIAAIHAGKMAPGQKVLSSRALAEKLGIARNTATAVYDELVARSYLEAQPRRGLFVATRGQGKGQSVAGASVVDWQARIGVTPSKLNHIRKPLNWQDYPYPFIFGQVDPRLFPLNAWRNSSRDTLGRASLDWWAADRAVDDDPMLIEQIRTRILPERDAKVYFHWLENIEPWCISRQLWWGHQIPVWYGFDLGSPGFEDDEGDGTLDLAEMLRLLNEGHLGPLMECGPEFESVANAFRDRLASLPVPLSAMQVVEVESRDAALHRLASALADYTATQDPTHLVYPVWRDPD
uniref:class I tRNA ligase family protein n=1 Tax=Thioclava electrotropha TaxID=1549850 RepID=UPI0023A8B489